MEDLCMLNLNMKFNWREDMGYYSSNYPPHTDSTVITDGDSKKNIKNRERIYSGKPDSGSKGSETKELADRNNDRKVKAEDKERLTKKALRIDQKDEDLSDYREDQHKTKESVSNNKRDLYNEGEGDFGDLEEVMREMDLDRLSKEDPEEYRRQMSVLDYEMEQSIELGQSFEDPDVAQWKKEKNFSQNSGGKSNTGANKAKFFRK